MVAPTIAPLILTLARSHLAFAILALLGAFENVPKSGQTSPSPAAQPAGGVVILEPFRERPAGPKHTPAEQDQS
jgi:hypothetical protein